MRNQYSVHSAVQSWRFNQSDSWISPGRQSLTSNHIQVQQTYGRGIATPLYYKKNANAKWITVQSDIFSQIQDLWAINDKSFDNMKDRWMRQTNMTTPMKDWIPQRGRPLNSEELKMKTMTAAVKVLERASLDGVEFRTQRSQEKKTMDNASVMMQYQSLETRQVVMGYGRITDMYIHRFWPEEGAPEKIIVVADWYEQIGTNPVNGLPQIRFQQNFSSCQLAFLEDCVPKSCKFLPSNPFDDSCDLFDVIQ